MKGRRGLDQGKIAWLSDRMCLVTHSLFLLEPRQPTKATHGRREEGGGGCRMSVCVSVCVFVCVPAYVWRKKRYIVSFFCLERLWYASKMPTAVTASSTKCSCGKHTHTHTHACTQIAAEPLEKNTPNVFRKLLCPGRENLFLFSFFLFCPKQTNSNTLSFPTPQSEDSPLCRTAGPAWTSLFREETFPLRHVCWPLSQLQPNETKWGRLNRVSDCSWRSNNTQSEWLLSINPPPGRLCCLLAFNISTPVYLMKLFPYKGRLSMSGQLPSLPLWAISCSHLSLSLSHLFFISQVGDSGPRSSRHFSLLVPPENNKLAWTRT